MEIEPKICTLCEKPFPATREYFYRNAETGLAPYCKKCAGIKNRENARLRKCGDEVTPEYLQYDDSPLAGLVKGSDEYVKRWNELHKVVKSFTRKEHVKTLRGSDERLVVM